MTNAQQGDAQSPAVSFKTVGCVQITSPDRRLNGGKSGASPRFPDKAKGCIWLGLCHFYALSNPKCHSLSEESKRGHRVLAYADDYPHGS